MNILVINAGSSSLKYQLIEMNNEQVIAKGLCERIGAAGSVLKTKDRQNKSIELVRDMPNHTVAISFVLEALINPEYGVLKSMDDIEAVGHRVVHSGEDFTHSVKIDDNVLEICRRNAELAPLHVPANIMGIEACKEVMPKVPMVAVFDTAFHSTMPPHAYMYAIPYEAYTDWKIRRYGFHGTSHKYVAEEAARYLGKDLSNLKIVTCHLGNGASVAAVKNGKSIDTTMGFTPLEGLPMGTRCGDIDPAIIEFIMRKTGYDINEAVDYLNKKSGMLGLSGFSSDFRDLTDALHEGHERATLAVDVFSYRVKKTVGSYAAAMGGIDVLVFTAGVGEHTPEVRERVCADMEFLGIKFDNEKNYNVVRGKLEDLSGQGSKVKVLLVPTDEELVIARETKEIVKK